MAAPKKTEPESLLEVGSLVNLERGGRTLQNLEVLGFDEHFIKLRWDIHVSPQTEIVLVPWEKVEALGLVGER